MEKHFFYSTNPRKMLPNKLRDFTSKNNVEITAMEAVGTSASFNPVCLMISYETIDTSNPYDLSIVGPCKNGNIESKVNNKISKFGAEFVKIAGCKDSFFVFILHKGVLPHHQSS